MEFIIDKKTYDEYAKQVDFTGWQAIPFNYYNLKTRVSYTPKQFRQQVNDMSVKQLVLQDRYLSKVKYSSILTFNPQNIFNVLWLEDGNIRIWRFIPKQEESNVF